MSAVEGQAGATSGGSEYNALAFLVQQIVGRLNTATLVKVLACTNAGGVSAAGTVDVQLLVNQVDGSGNAVANARVFTVPYFRLQGGANAIIVDPQPGDIGIAVFADHDISRVKNTKAAGNPGSRRRFALGDALYLGGMLNGAPTQYARFYSGGIQAKDASGNTVDMHASGIDLSDDNGNTISMNATGITVNGTLFRRDHSVWTDAEITAMTNHTVSQHQHSQGNDSHGDAESDVNKPYN